MHRSRFAPLVGRLGLGIALGGMLVAGAVNPFSPKAHAADTLYLNGAGSTFAQPFYSLWIYNYQKSHPNAKINYQGIGSGAGIKQVQAGIVDWGGTDAPMTDADQAASRAGHVLNLPMAIGPVVLSYNLPGVDSGLKLSQKALTDIYLGKVTNWNDAEIATENPGVKLPRLAIAVVHRADASGTSFIFSDYLTHISPEWKDRVGTSKSPNWPVGLGGKGNPGVAGLISQIPGAIGYVEYAYALQNKLPVAALENKDGNYVLPSMEAASIAAAGVEMPSDFAVSIVDAEGPKAYPIVSFTWLMLPQSPKDAAKGAALVDFVKWGLIEGQKLLPQLDYVPVPESVVQQELAALDAVQLP